MRVRKSCFNCFCGDHVRYYLFACVYHDYFELRGCRALLSSSNEDSYFILDDIKILLNDWPYGFSENIVHLVIWTRFTLDSDPATGDITERSRELIDFYVNHVFGDYVEAGKVLLTNISFLHSAPADSG